MTAKGSDPGECKFNEARTRVLSSVARTLASLGEQGFFGTVELKFEAGCVVLLRKSETIKPEDCRDNRDHSDDH
jgi:hypothetical protein